MYFHLHIFYIGGAATLFVFLPKDLDVHSGCETQSWCFHKVGECIVRRLCPAVRPIIETLEAK